jgi:hypothetical protein
MLSENEMYKERVGKFADPLFIFHKVSARN